MHRIWLVLALAAVACGPKKKPVEDEFPIPEATPDAGPSSNEELPAALVAKIDRAMGVMEQIAVATEQNKEDCDAMAAALHAIAESPDGKIILELDMDPDYQANAKAVEQKYTDQLVSFGNRISAGISACPTKGVDDALTELGLGE